ncbi:MAG: hypothetical protein WAK57_04150 [Desulfobacterales bacterium]
MGDPAGPVFFAERTSDARRAFEDGIFFLPVSARTFLVAVDRFAAGFLFPVDMASLPFAGRLSRMLPPEDVFGVGGRGRRRFHASTGYAGAVVPGRGSYSVAGFGEPPYQAICPNDILIFQVSRPRR